MRAGGGLALAARRSAIGFHAAFLVYALYMDTDLSALGVGLATLMIGLFAWLRADISRLGAGLRAVEHGQAKLEGLLGEAISGRNAA